LSRAYCTLLPWKMPPDANDPAARLHDAHRTPLTMHDCPETTQLLGGGRFQAIA
jgi:hypothetical protein